jgi:glycerol-3-phosphate O-acyltransferase
MFNFFWGLIYMLVNLTFFLVCSLVRKEGVICLDRGCHGHRQYSSR